MSRPRLLGPQLLKSLAVHAAALAVLLIVGSRQTERIQQRQHKFRAGLQEQRRLADQQAREEQAELSAQMIRDQLRQEFKELVADELEPSDEQDLMLLIEESLREHLDAAMGGQEPAELAPSDWAPVREAVRHSAFEDLRQRDLSRLVKEAILAEVRRFARQEAAPALCDRIERELKSHAGRAIEQALVDQAVAFHRQRAQAAREALQNAAEQLRQTEAAERHLADALHDEQADTARLAPEHKALAEQYAAAAAKAQAALAQAVHVSPAVAEEVAGLSRQESPSESVRKTGLSLEAGDRQQARQHAEQAASHIKNQIAELDRLARDLRRQTTSRRGLAPLDKALGRAVMTGRTDVEQALRATVARELNATAIPRLARQVTARVSSQLERVGWRADLFTAAVEAEISQALQEALAGDRKPDATVAARRAEAAVGIADPGAIEEARQAIDVSIQRLTGLIERLERADTTSAGELKELVEQLAAAQEQTKAALREGRRSTAAADSAIDTAQQHIARNRLRSNLAAAAHAAEAGTAAAEKTSAAAQDAQNVVALLAKASQALGEEGAAPSRQQAAAAGVSLGEVLGDQCARRHVDTATGAVAGVAASSAAESVARASSLRDGDSPISSSGGSRIARMKNLAEKLDQIAENVAAGRGLGTQLAGGLAFFQQGPNTGSLAGPAPGGAFDGMHMGPNTGGAQSPLSLSGTMIGGPDTGGRGDGIPNSTGGKPAGIGDNYGARYGFGVNQYAQINRELYERYLRLSGLRAGSRVGDAYGEVTIVEGPVSLATMGLQRKPQLVYVRSHNALGSGRGTDADSEERPLIRPRFDYLAYGAFQFQHGELVVDGDLSDWGDLCHPLHLRWKHDGTQAEQGIPVFARWSPQGLYVCYHVPDRGPDEIQPPAARPGTDDPRAKPYEGDVMEVWIDVDNLRRKWMAQSPYAQQFVLMPFGYNGDPQTTFCEVGRGFRGISRHDYRFDSTGRLGKAAARFERGGYTVEGFISHKALAKPKLRTGQYIALNFSISRGYDYQSALGWSMAKDAAKSYDRPDTWGDVLLLGTDGCARFVDARDPARPPQVIVAGEPVGVEVVDPDMDLDPTRCDAVLAEVRATGNSSCLYVILQETHARGGVFLGSFNTQPHYLPLRANTLNVRDGARIQLLYRDLRAACGERNRPVEAELELGVPLMRFAGEGEWN